MSFMIFADHANRIIYQKVQGEFNSSQMFEANSYIATINNGYEYNLLLDFHAMRLLDVPESVLESIGHKIRYEMPVRLRAMVVSERFRDQAIAFATHASNAFENVRVCEDLASACRWLLISEPDLLSKCGGYRPTGNHYDAGSDHWSYMSGMPR